MFEIIVLNFLLSAMALVEVYNTVFLVWGWKGWRGKLSCLLCLGLLLS